MTAPLALLLAMASVPACSDGTSEPPPVVTLTARQPVAWIPIDQAVTTGAADVLQLSITRVVNPKGTALSLAASLERLSKGQSTSSPARIGTITLYPPDRPGTYLLRATRALASVRAQDRSSAPLHLRLELKHLHEQQDLSGVAVDVAPPLWRDAPVPPRPD